MQNRLAVVSLDQSPSKNVKPANYWAEKGKKLIGENYAELYTSGDICSRLGISTGYFHDIFFSAFGVTPKICLTSAKIERAKTILKDRWDSVKVAEVAKMVGFRSRVSFERAFVKHVGVSPSEFRKISNAVDFDTRK